MYNNEYDNTDITSLTHSIIYELLEEPMDYAGLLLTYPPELHTQLKRILLDGLINGVFGIMYGDCYTGIWHHNEHCGTDRLEKFLSASSKTLSLPPEVYSEIFSSYKKNSHQKLLKATKTKNRTIIRTNQTKSIRKPYRKIPTNIKKRDKQARKWNDDIAHNFQKELDRLRNLRFENNLNGIDRGALK